MYLDITRFPLVFLRDDGEPAKNGADEAQIEVLLDRGERFVLITDHLPGDDHGQDETHEERKQKSLFFKRNKVRLQSLCAGLVLITGDRSVSIITRTAVQTLGKVLGLKCAFVLDDAAALEEGARLMLR